MCRNPESVCGLRDSKGRWKLPRKGAKETKQLLCFSHPVDSEMRMIEAWNWIRFSKGYREGKNMKGQLQKTKTMRALMKTPCKHRLQVDIKVMSLWCPKENQTPVYRVQTGIQVNIKVMSLRRPKENSISVYPVQTRLQVNIKFMSLRRPKENWITIYHVQTGLQVDLKVMSLWCPKGNWTPVYHVQTGLQVDIKWIVSTNE